MLHVVPTPRGRGAELGARLLADRLDEPEGVRHRLLGLFDGPEEVAIELSLGQPGGGDSAKGFRPQVALRLRRMLARLRPAAVVAHGGDAMKYAVPAVTGSGRPLVYCVIGTYGGSPSRRHEWVWKRIMAQADLVVPVGNEVRDECSERFGVPASRLVLVPYGRDPRQWRSASISDPPSEPTIIFVGALTPQKQPDRFIEVVRRLRAEGRSFRARLVGDGPLFGALTPLAANVGIDVLGHRSDVAELLRRADVFVFPSRPTCEGMPGVLIEAGMCGLPTVSTRVPGASTVIRDEQTGVIVEDSTDAMAAAVGQLLDDTERRRRMGAAARRWCESQFTLDLMAQRWRAALHLVGV